jgi:hypothetical protein
MSSFPLSVSILIALMLWPAIWGGALMLVALCGDLTRQFKVQTFSTRRKAA